jgi:ABC-2 type transport system ATP-binding protein
VVREEVARGRTVLLSSHILAEAESLSDRISIIRAGRTVASGTLDELRGLTQTTVVARLRHPDGVGEITGLRVVSAVDSEVTAEADSEQLSEVMAALAGHGIESLVVHPPTLEEMFLRHYDEPGGVLHRRGAGTGGAR